MKVKTSELTGAALDWAVAMCENRYDEASSHAPFQWFKKPYCTDWAVSGPIIEREKISVGYTTAGGETWLAAMSDDPFYTSGVTALVAAMRCYCCKKLGNEIDIPKELA